MEVVHDPTAAPYAPTGDFYDEAIAADGGARDHYRTVLEQLAASDLGALADAVADRLTAAGVQFGANGRARPFAVDPVPRIFTSAEWSELAAGLAQRVRALNAFAADAYHARDIVAAGRLPAHVLERAEHFEPAMHGIPVPHSCYAHVAGLDVVRGVDGRLLVLEDNLRTPSGLAYAAAAREAVEELVVPAPRSPPRPIDIVFETMGRALVAAAPDGRTAPSVVLLSDGPHNSAWYEHCELARRIGVPLVTIADLELHRGRLFARGAPVDVVYRRTDEDRLTTPDGRPTALGAVLLEPVRAGTLACVNAFGAGVADDKLVHAYVEEMVRFYLGEEPLLASVPTYDLNLTEEREAALGRLDELVVKPRAGHGGHGVMIGSLADRATLERTAAEIESAPHRYIAQETVGLSHHPTVCDGSLEPRHVDLRPFAITVGDTVEVIPGGLTRFARAEGALVVNSSRDGGGKDTWVLP